MYKISYRFGQNLNLRFKNYQLPLMENVDALYQHSVVSLSFDTWKPGFLLSDFLGVIDGSTVTGMNIVQKAYVDPDYSQGFGREYHSWSDYLKRKALNAD